MAYIGNEPFVSGNFSSSVHNGTGSELTFAMGQSPGTKNAVLVFIDGVRQVPTIYGVSGSDVVFTAGNAPPSGTSNVQILVSGEELGVNVPADDSVTTAKILDDSVTTDKLANAINTTIAANTAKVTNATHTGDVTGATALTIAVDAVDIPMLSATGTADATTFLRGDNAWEAAGGGGLVALRVYTAASTTWSKSTNDPTKIIVEVIAGGGGTGAGAFTGGSGAAGAYAKVFLDVSTVDTATVTVGAAGLGGSSSGAGGVGGTSKFTYLSGTGSFTEIECVGGNGGGYNNHVGGATTALPTGPANGIYIKGSGGGGASSAGNVAHGYGASQSTSTSTTTAVGYGAANCTDGGASTGPAATQGLVLVWEYL